MVSSRTASAPVLKTTLAPTLLMTMVSDEEGKVSADACDKKGRDLWGKVGGGGGPHKNKTVHLRRSKIKTPA